jgi:very-short-patch-repair endonuclease
MNKDKAVIWLHYWNTQNGIHGGYYTWEPEYNFDKELGRRHRFDWALPLLRVAVEIDGGGWMPRGGRHGTDKDREKLNIAAALGWLVFRFSEAMLEADPYGCVMQVYNAIQLRK